MKRLNEIMGKIDTLPLISNIVSKASDLLNKTDIEPEDIVEIIKYEPSVTANILKICNSAYYGLMRKVSSLKEAATYIGTEELLKIALTAGTTELLNKKVEGYQLDEGELFKHSIGCAVASQLLSKKLSVMNASMLFTGSLLHDMGKLVLSQFVREEYNNIYNLVLEKKCSFIEAEREILDTGHAEIGALLAEKWNFPEELIILIRYHHEPEKGPKSQSQNLEVVHLSDLLCLIAGIGIGADGIAYKAELHQKNILDLVNKDLDSIIYELLTELEKVKASYNF